MNELSIRELKAKASEVLRGVREQGKRYVITHRGRPVAVLTPISRPASVTDNAETREEKWKRWQELSVRVNRAWKSKKSSTEILSSMRR